MKQEPNLTDALNRVLNETSKSAAFDNALTDFLQIRDACRSAHLELQGFEWRLACIGGGGVTPAEVKG